MEKNVTTALEAARAGLLDEATRIRGHLALLSLIRPDVHASHAVAVDAVMLLLKQVLNRIDAAQSALPVEIPVAPVAGDGIIPSNNNR
jgi:hypothetical protein